MTGLTLKEKMAKADEAAAKMGSGGAYDPNIGTAQYLTQQSKLVPAGLAGLGLDTAYNIRDLGKIALATPWIVSGKVPPKSLQIDEPKSTAELDHPDGALANVIQSITQDRLGGSGTFASAFGYERTKPPGQTTELVSDITNATLSFLLFKKTPGGPELTTSQVVLGGIGSGTGANIGRRVMPDSPAAEAAGGIIGGVGAIGAGEYAKVAPSIQAARSVLSSASREKILAKYKDNIEPVIRRMVEKTIAKELRTNPTALSNVEKSQALAGGAPGTKLDIGQASLVPSLVQASKAAALSSPQALNEKAMLDAANRAAVSGSMDTPTSGPTIGTLGARAVDQQRNSLADLENVVTAGEKQKADIAQQIPSANREALGRSARDLRTATEGVAKAENDRMLSEVDRLAAGSTYDISGVVGAVESAAEKPIFKYAPERKPKIFSRIEELRKSSEPAPAPSLLSGGPTASPSPPAEAAGSVMKEVDFKELRSMREAVNEDIRQASGPTTQDRTMRRELSAIKSSIDQAITEKGGPAAEAYQKFIDHYRDTYVPRFLQGTNVEQTLKTSTGVEKIPDEALFSQYFSSGLRGGGARAARQYVKLYGNSAEGRRLMHDAVLDRYRTEVIGTRGEVNPTAHDAFMLKYGTPLRILKEAGINAIDDLSSVGSASKAVFDRIATAKDAQRAAADDVFQRVIHDQFGPKSTDVIMKDVASDPRKATIVLSRLGKPGAEGMVSWFSEDLAGVVSDAPQGKLGSSLATKLADKNYMGAYKAALIKAYGEAGASAHLKKIGELAELSRRLSVTELDPFAGLGNAELSQGFSDKAGFTVRSVWSLTRAVITGRSSVSDSILVLGGQFGSKQIETIRAQVMREMISDPEVLNRVLTLAKAPAPTEPGAIAAAKWLTTRAPELLRALGLGIGRSAAKSTLAAQGQIVSAQQENQQANQ